jgi:hypothetical protein
MGKTPSKHLAARHGRGTAWAQHAMRESAFRKLLGLIDRKVGTDRVFLIVCDELPMHST